MQITHKTLPHSRVSYTVTLTELEVAEYYEQAVTRLSSSVKLPGFRPGKAPADLVRAQLTAEALREEAYTLGVQGSWQEVVKGLEKGPIQDPEVEVDEFVEGKPATITFAFDIRPEVTVAGVEKIKITEPKKEPIGKKQVQEMISSLQKVHAKTIITLNPAATGNKVDLTFTGSIKGVAKEKLSSKHFPMIIGEDAVIPGFAEQVIGLKKNDTKKFSLPFPADHFDKELAGQKVDFELTVEEVYTIELPPVNDELAKHFGHDTLIELEAAITKDLIDRQNEELFVQRKASWLSEFEKCVKTELPESLVAAEVERARASWLEFLERRNLKQDDWLARQNTTLEQMEKDWHKAAESSVTIGLGLSRLAIDQKRALDTNEQYQEFLDELVQQAIDKK